MAASFQPGRARSIRARNRSILSLSSVKGTFMLYQYGVERTIKLLTCKGARPAISRSHVPGASAIELNLILYYRVGKYL